MKIILYGVLCFGIWTAASTYWYLCQIENMCPTEINNSGSAQNISSNAMDSKKVETPIIAEEETITEKEDEELSSDIDFEETLVYYFDFNDENLHENLSAKVDFVLMLEYIKAKPEVQIQITGHTDNVGNKASNHSLGLMRAQQTAALLKTHGIATERIKLRSAGEQEPMASNDTDQGRAKNRRIEIDIIK